MAITHWLLPMFTHLMFRHLPLTRSLALALSFSCAKFMTFRQWPCVYKYVSYNIEIAFVKFHQFSHAYFIIKCRNYTIRAHNAETNGRTEEFRENGGVDGNRAKENACCTIRYLQPNCKHTQHSIHNMKYVKFAHELHRTHTHNTTSSRV